MGREFEQKYAATEAILADLAVQYPDGHMISMQTAYYDTPDGALSAQQMTLRIRSENDQQICTLKTPLSNGSRGEWECPAGDIATGLCHLLALGAPLMLRSPNDLRVVCGARFNRWAVPLPTADGMAELALDQGVLLGGGKELPFWEVELELKSGSEEALLSLAHQLAAAYHLKPEPKSKFRRALELAQGE